ncbi:hypothetical protein V5799_030726 [Amblyomma americanum]|uniref:Uncharacterized protein n=1 Tax=Amblyomma americanum TaxID=6943 RepID=A0AAQ4EMK0_AMBAM
MATRQRRAPTRSTRRTRPQLGLRLQRCWATSLTPVPTPRTRSTADSHPAETPENDGGPQVPRTSTEGQAFCASLL